MEEYYYQKRIQYDPALCFEPFLTVFVGDIPLHMAIRETSDNGAPITISHADSPQAKAYKELATNVLNYLPDYLDSTNRKQS